MKNIYYLLIISLLWACSGNSDQGKKEGDMRSTEVDSLKEAVKANAASISMDKNWYRQYVGTLNGNLPIHFSLVKIGPKLRGSYYYDRHGIPLNLTDGELAKDGSFSFNEYGDIDQTGSINALLKGDKIQGFWFNKDQSKKLLLDLVQDTSSQQMLFDVFHESKVVALVEGDTASPTHTFIQTLLYPSVHYQGDKKEAIYELFNDIFKGNLANGNPYQTIANMHKEAVETYQKTNTEIYKEDPSYGYSMNWSEVAHMEVVYNSQNILTVRQSWYNFTGGAHGNYGANYYVMNLQKGTRMMLKDVIDPKYNADIAEMVRQKIWEQRGLQTGETLQDVGFDTEGINPTENFLLSHKGIGFYYGPYQIGPYALGSVEIFIPFKECQKFLTSAFQKTL